MMDSIPLTWKRIEDWFEKFAPASAKYFFPGAAPSEITAVRWRWDYYQPISKRATRDIMGYLSMSASSVMLSV